MTKNKKFSSFLEVLFKSNKGSKAILVLLVVFLSAYAVIMLSGAADAKTINIVGKSSSNKVTKIDNSKNSNKVKNTPIDSFVPLGASNNIKIDTKKTVDTTKKLPKRPSSTRTLPTKTLPATTTRIIKPKTTTTNRLDIRSYKPNITTYKKSNNFQYSSSNIPKVSRVNSVVSIDSYDYDPTLLQRKSVTRNSSSSAKRSLTSTPVKSRSVPVIVGANSTWKAMDRISTSRKSILSNGANCVSYLDGSKGCFPVAGRPSEHKWHSYSKGTCLQDCTNYAPADHQAIDIYTAHGRSVYSVWDGTVIAAYWHDVGGNTILVRHNKFGTVTVYVHLSKMLVKNGQQVKAGQLIGTIGATGSSASGPHLHFRIHDINHSGYKQSRWAPLTEYETVGLAPFRGIRKGMFHGEHLVAHL